MANAPLYFRETTGISHPASIDSATKSAVWPWGTDKSLTAQTARDLSTTKGSSQTSRAGINASTTNGNVSGRVNTYCIGVGGADVPAENITTFVGFSASSVNSFPLQYGLSIYILKSDGTVRGYVYDSTTLLDTAQSAGAERFHNATIAGSAVTGVLSSDFLCVEFWLACAQATTSSRTGTGFWDGTTASGTDNNTTSDVASYIQFATWDHLGADEAGAAVVPTLALMGVGT